jgi:hypothetical protein
MTSSPSLPVIITCSGCLLALVVGLVFRTSTLLGGMARLGFLPKGLTRWLLDANSTKPRHP